MLSFGTDGVRGLANAQLTPEYALTLGRAAARVLASGAGERRVVVGRDPRRSGTLLESALAAGSASEGVDVTLLGVVPTPAVAHIAARDEVPGAMISASHNPFADNGIKLFAAGGTKLSDATEAALEAELAALAATDPRHEDRSRPVGAAVGAIDTDAGEAVSSYATSVRAAIEGRSLDGLSVVLDCAHGAGSTLGPQVLESLGVRCTVVHAEPDGCNINEDAGSTSPAALEAAVVAHGADVGLALDGDADRLLAVDAEGALVDGDQIISILAIDRKAGGRLPDDRVVVTVMSNLGFRLGMEAHGIDVEVTAVGDRYVLEGLARTGALLGGEQSGHVIQADLATTGDGLLTAVSLLDVLARTGRPLAELAADAMTVLPQVLVNVSLERRDSDLLDALADDIARCETRLGDHGRVLVRPSGTEPLIRVMVEAPTAEQAGREAEILATAVRRASVGS